MNTYIFETTGVMPGACAIIVANTEDEAKAALMTSTERPIVNGEPWEKFKLVATLDHSKPGEYWLDGE